MTEDAKQRSRVTKHGERRDMRKWNHPALPARTELREDGHEHLSPCIGHTRCEECGGQIPLFAEGRRRRFCDPTCRKRHSRRTPTLPGI